MGQNDTSKRMRSNRPKPPMNPFMCLCGRRADACLKQRTEKQMMADRLHPKIQVVQPQLAGYLTTILLQRMGNAGLLAMLSDQKVLMHMINAALVVLEDCRRWALQQIPNPMTCLTAPSMMQPYPIKPWVPMRTILLCSAPPPLSY